MILSTVKKSLSPQIDLTPLINIVFLILIFFMLAGSIKPVDPVQAAKIESEGVVDAELLIVAITREGIVQIERTAVSDSELLTILTKHQATDGRIGVKPDARLLAERLVELTAVVRQAGYKELTLITEKP